MLWSENVALVLLFLFVVWIVYSIVSFSENVFFLKLIVAAVVGLFVIHELHRAFESS